jgi:hypothetical protein
VPISSASSIAPPLALAPDELALAISPSKMERDTVRWLLPALSPLSMAPPLALALGASAVAVLALKAEFVTAR